MPQNHIQLLVSRSVQWTFDVDHVTMVETCAGSFNVIPTCRGISNVFMYKPSAWVPGHTYKNFSLIRMKLTEIRGNRQSHKLLYYIENVLTMHRKKTTCKMFMCVVNRLTIALTGDTAEALVCYRRLTEVEDLQLLKVLRQQLEARVTKLSTDDTPVMECHQNVTI